MSSRQNRKCTVCSRSFADCKHSIADEDRWRFEQDIRRIVRDEIKQIAKREAVAEERLDRRIKKELGWDLLT